MICEKCRENGIENKMRTTNTYIDATNLGQSTYRRKQCDLCLWVIATEEHVINRQPSYGNGAAALSGIENRHQMIENEEILDSESGTN